MWWLIIIGVVIIGYALYELLTYYNKENSPSSEKVRNIQSKSSTGMNRFAAVRETGAVSKQVSLDRVLTDKTVSTLNLAEAPERYERSLEKEKAIHDNDLTLTLEATALKMTPASLNELNRLEQANKLNLQLKEGESRIKIDESRQLAQIDVQKDYDTRMNQLKAVLALKVFPYMKLAEIRAEIYKLLLEDAQVADSTLPPTVKAEYRLLLQDTIVGYRRTYERGLGLLQAVDGQDVGGTDVYAELGSGVEDPSQADNE